MHIEIQARNFTLTEALQNHADRRLYFSLTPCVVHIQRIVMRLSEDNGPVAGTDKCCQLQLVLSGLPDVVTEQTETDFYVAIDRAINCARLSLVRKTGQQHSLPRQGQLSIQKMQLPTNRLTN
ncbi:HPF/RaiA family ribosome-associated protein [Pseudomonadota bacterium]